MMRTNLKSVTWFNAFVLVICLNTLFLSNAVAQAENQLSATAGGTNYTVETINVPDTEFLAVAASSDFDDYAGYTLSADGEKEVAFTLIDGVFMRHDFPGSQKTHFYALGNDGRAAGHYQDADGMYHGVILEDGELRQYDFPDSAQTFIYGISDATGALTGNWIDASGVQRGFSGDEIIEFPGALETHAHFVNASGGMVGSYVDADGIYHPYVRTPDGRFLSLDLPRASDLEYFFVHGINDAGVVVARSKLVGDVPRTLVGKFQEGLQELKVTGGVSTEGWNINQDGSIVGHYESADGSTNGFVAKPVVPVDDPVVKPPTLNYTFESIDVPGVDILALTASSDFEDYAGYTRSPDGEKDVAFTLIDGAFARYDFPGAQNTYFFALGNNGNAAGHYQDSDGLYHGVVLENGELRQFDFPGSVQTEIYGISDATGALTGNFTDDSGIRRGFSGDTIVEVPEALETFADFVAAGRLVGSYVDADGIYHPYARTPEGRIVSIDLPGAATLEYMFLHGINDVGTMVGRSKRVGGIPRTHVGTFRDGLQELTFPNSVFTEGYNINQDGSVVGHYQSADGRVHGFIARPVSPAVSNYFGNVYDVTLAKGLNMISVPLAPPKPMSAEALAGLTGATTVITLDSANQLFVGWTPGAPNDGFPIQGGKAYIVNVPESRNFAFVGAPWTDRRRAAASPPAISVEISQDQNVWAFVVSGHLNGRTAYDGYRVIVRNLRTNSTLSASVDGDYFAAATADLARRSVVEVGDVIELHVVGPDGNVESHTARFNVSPEHLANAVLSVRLDGIGRPEQDLLLQNYPNPFNPETWIPYQLSGDGPVSVSIYDTTGALVRTLSLGIQSAGFYNSRGRAAYWDGRNDTGEHVSSGLYFYQLRTPTFHQTRRLVIMK